MADDVIKKYISGKGKTKVSIYDLEIVDESEVQDNGDTLITLKLYYDEYYASGYESTLKLKNPHRDDKNKYYYLLEVWKETLLMLYYMWIKNKDINNNLLVHQNQESWNGSSELPLAFINNYKITDNEIILYRFFNNVVDKKIENSLITKFSFLIEDSIIRSTTHLTYNRMPMIKHILRPIIDDDYPQEKTNQIDFIATPSCKKDKFEVIKNDDNFYNLYIDPDELDAIYLLSKEKLSNDIKLDLDCKVRSVFRKDTYFDKPYKENTSCKLKYNSETTDLVKFDLDYNLEGSITSEINLDNLYFTEKNYVDKNKYVEENIKINNILCSKGYLYIYFDKFNTISKDLNYELDILDIPFYRRTSETTNTGIKTIQQVITYNSDYEYDIISRIYTYTFNLNTDIKDIDNITNYTITPETRTIESASVKDNVLTIKSKYKLCSKDGVPKCTFRFDANYTYIEYRDIYAKVVFGIDLSYDFDTSKLETDEEGNLFYKCCYDETHIDKYTNMDDQECKFNNNISYVGSSFTDLHNIIDNWEVNGKTISVYFYKDIYFSIIENRLLSDINLNIRFNGIKPELYPGYEYVTDDIFHIHTGSDTVMEPAYYKTKRVNGEDIYYYYYKFYSENEFLPKDYSIQEKNIEFILNQGDDLVYDLEYDNGLVTVYLYDDKNYAYTDISLSFNIGEYTHTRSEIYEIYTFKEDAKDKLKDLIFGINRIRNNLLPKYTIDDLIKEINSK